MEIHLLALIIVQKVLLFAFGTLAAGVILSFCICYIFNQIIKLKNKK